mgnify:CR=1 FL=1
MKIKQMMPTSDWYAVMRSEERKYHQQVACWVLVENEDGEDEIRGFGTGPLNDYGFGGPGPGVLVDLSQKEDFTSYSTQADHDLRMQSKRIKSLFPCEGDWFIVWKNKSNDSISRTPIAMWAEYETEDKSETVDSDRASVVGMIMGEDGLLNLGACNVEVLGYQRNGIQEEKVTFNDDGAIDWVAKKDY